MLALAWRQLVRLVRLVRLVLLVLLVLLVPLVLLVLLVLLPPLLLPLALLPLMLLLGLPALPGTTCVLDVIRRRTCSGSEEERSSPTACSGSKSSLPRRTTRTSVMAIIVEWRLRSPLPRMAEVPK